MSKIKKAKKILVISNMYPSKRYPHYGVFVKNTVDILRNEGYKISVISKRKVNNKLAKLLSYVNFYTKILLCGIFGRFDMFYAHYASHTALPLLMLKKFKNIRLIMNVHGNDIVPETANDEKYLNMVKKVLNISERIIAPSFYFKRILIDEYNIDEKLIDVYPSGGVDINLFNKISANKVKSRLSLSGDYRYIGYVSRIEEKKGWDIFLEACKKIISENLNIKLIVVGDGDQSNDFFKKVETLDLKDDIIKYDLLSQDDLVYLYNSLDIFVFPTYRRSESLGLVGLEAMSCECLCVLPDKYGPASYGVNMQNALVFKAGEINSLYEKISLGLNLDNDALLSIKRSARETALKYGRENQNIKLIEIFKNIS